MVQIPTSQKWNVNNQPNAIQGLKETASTSKNYGAEVSASIVG